MTQQECLGFYLHHAGVAGRTNMQDYRLMLFQVFLMRGTQQEPKKSQKKKKGEKFVNSLRTRPTEFRRTRTTTCTEQEKVNVLTMCLYKATNTIKPVQYYIELSKRP